MINTEKLQNLPNKLSMKFSEKSHNKKIKYWGEYRYKPKYNPWKICKKILENNIGKSFSLAFSYYCKFVSKHEQYIFLEEFESNKRTWKYWGCYYIDEFNNIQYQNNYNKTKKKIILYSNDYKTELRHKVTGKKHPEYIWLYKDYNKDDYVLYIISGDKYIFETKKDPKYKRLFNDQLKQSRKKDRINNLLKKEIQYNFLTKEEQKIKDSLKNDLIKRDSHGFDENSFKGIEYHGQKRKLK